LQDQRESDGVLDDLSCMLGCTRSSLHGEQQQRQLHQQQ
jgi:DNA topoisomerase VI subunit A